LLLLDAQILRLRPPLLLTLPSLSELPIRRLPPCVFLSRHSPSHIRGESEVQYRLAATAQEGVGRRGRVTEIR